MNANTTYQLKQVYIQLLRTLTTWHYPRAPDSKRSISPARRAYCSKPATAGLLLWAYAGTNRLTNRRTDTVPLHRPFSANNRKRRSLQRLMKIVRRSVGALKDVYCAIGLVDAIFVNFLFASTSTNFTAICKQKYNVAYY